MTKKLSLILLSIITIIISISTLPVLDSVIYRVSEKELIVVDSIRHEDSTTTVELFSNESIYIIRTNIDNLPTDKSLLLFHYSNFQNEILINSSVINLDINGVNDRTLYYLSELFDNAFWYNGINGVSFQDILNEIQSINSEIVLEDITGFNIVTNILETSTVFTKESLTTLVTDPQTTYFEILTLGEGDDIKDTPTNTLISILPMILVAGIVVSSVLLIKRTD